MEKQEIAIDNFDAVGLILDIGAGGEGVIGQLKGKQVVAIDPNKKELEDAAEGPLKIVMDASDLLFLDDTFHIVTSFFTLMYIKDSQHDKVFEEAFRILVSGGRFILWDLDLPQCLDESKEIVAVYLNIKLPEKEIMTGYGTRWPNQEQGLPYYKNVAEKVGFVATDQKVNGRVFQLELKKP
ncbi:class I SAM-dependent methyltransferase [Chloroflexota bacterium]